jgi:hypothetical protein
MAIFPMCIYIYILVMDKSEENYIQSSLDVVLTYLEDAGLRLIIWGVLNIWDSTSLLKDSVQPKTRSGYHGYTTPT